LTLTLEGQPLAELSFTQRRVVPAPVYPACALSIRASPASNVLPIRVPFQPLIKPSVRAHPFFCPNSDARPDQVRSSSVTSFPRKHGALSPRESFPIAFEHFSCFPGALIRQLPLLPGSVRLSFQLLPDPTTTFKARAASFSLQPVPPPQSRPCQYLWAHHLPPQVASRRHRGLPSNVKNLLFPSPQAPLRSPVLPF